MRQLWTAAALLGGMLALLTWNGACLAARLAPMEQALTESVAAARQADWDRAEDLSAQVRTAWREALPYLRLVQSHGDLEEVTTLLDEAQAHLTARDTGDYAAFCARAMQEMAAIRDLERLSLGNLL